MATWIVCDFEECPEPATLHVDILEGDWKGLDFDACSFAHAEAYHDSLYTLPLDEEADA